MRMSSVQRLLPIIFLLLVAELCEAQPYRYGCHYFRQQRGEAPEMTPLLRAQIDETIARSDTFDILHYDIAMDVTQVGAQQITAATTITFVAKLAGQAFIRFDLVDLLVDSVIGAGGALTFDQTAGFLRVDLGTVPAVGEQRDITVHYHGHPLRDSQWGGFYFENGYIYNLGIGISTIPPNFGKVWYPCFDSFVERATYTYHVKSAGGYRLHGQGDFLGEVALGGDTVVRSFDLPYDIPTHISAVAVAAYVDSDYVHIGANGNIPVRLSAKAGQLAGMVSRFGDLGAAIDACEHWYGPYAWGRVGYVLTTDGALEIPTNVAYPQFMTNQPVADNRALFSHELGHHWWGDAVTPYVHNDMWIKEGPAEYTGHLVEEWLGGTEAFVNAVKNNQYDVLKNSHLQDGGFQPLSPMPDPYIYGHHTYYKGASVLHNLRGYLGDTLFQQTMLGVQQQFADSAVDANGFRDALELVSGVDLDPFFNAWVFAPGFSVFVLHDMDAVQQGNQWEVDLVLRQGLRGATVFHDQVPLDLTLIGDDWQRQEYRVTAGGEFTNLSVTAPFAPRMAVINGYNRLNQARMDHEFTIRPGETFTSTLPRVDFRLFADTLLDSALFRVDHIWSAPDADLLDATVDQISSTHYWVVDGVWPPGTELNARLNYTALSADQLDYDLYYTTEQDAMLLYRPDASSPWSAFPYQTIMTGPLTNRTGYFLVDSLVKGHYAFGKGQFISGVADGTSRSANALRLYPVPAANTVTVEWGGAEDLVDLEVTSADGRVVWRSGEGGPVRDRTVVPVSGWATGTYELVARDDLGAVLARAGFSVSR
ncbi:MAG: hypothetical protein IPK99_02215 [Flavobacteriales bacterium]|nr:hypothetical protein [Flavobacteriales bacterium]